MPDDQSRFDQAGVIACRGGSGGLRVLLVTSASGARWVIPKGIIDPGETPRACAAREALEEAGVRGRLSPDPVGRYSYKKWGGTCTVDVFLMEVEEELAEWGESHARERAWLSVEEAAERIRAPRLRRLIRSLAALRDAAEGPPPPGGPGGPA